MAAETNAIFEPVLRAVKEAPPLPEIYTLIEGVWLRSEIPPGRNDLALLEEGVRHFPEAAPLVLAAVQLHVNAGALDKAKELAERGRLFAWDASTREHFEQLCRKLAAASN